MRRGFFLLLVSILIFIVLSFFILPEFRYYVVIAFIIYAVLFTLLARYLMAEEFRAFSKIVLSKRARMISFTLLTSLIALVLLRLFLSAVFPPELKVDISEDRVLSLSPDSRLFIRGLRSNVELIYIRPLSGHDDQSLFNALSKELSSINPRLAYRTIHPVVNAMDYEDLKELMPSLTQGSVVVLSDRGISLSERVDEYQLILAIYRSLEGRRNVCISEGRGEPDTVDYSESGAGIIYMMMKDRGIDLIKVPSYNVPSACDLFILFEPSDELSVEEISSITSFNGPMIILGGTELKSVRYILDGFGMTLSDKVEAGFSLSALREYAGATLIDKISSHPISAAVTGTLSTSSAREIICEACEPLAGISSRKAWDGKVSTVIAIKDDVVVYSVNGFVKNFFMRFRGNAQILFNSVDFLTSEKYPFLENVPRPTIPGIFTISRQHMRLFYIILIYCVPLLAVLLSLYCFRLRTKKARSVK